MKRKIDVLICLALMLCLQATKAAVSGGPGDPIPLELIGNDDEIFGPGYPKSPDETPVVSLDDHTLYFADAFSEVVAIELKDASDTVVYSTNLPVSTQTLVLPATLSGTYTLFLYVGGLCYYGQITL